MAGWATFALAVVICLSLSSAFELGKMEQHRKDNEAFNAVCSAAASAVINEDTSSTSNPEKTK